MELSKSITFRLPEKDCHLINYHVMLFKEETLFTSSKGGFIRACLLDIQGFKDEFIKKTWIKYELGKKNDSNDSGMKSMTVRVSDKDKEFINKYVKYARKKLGIFVSTGDFISFCVNGYLNDYEFK